MFGLPCFAFLLVRLLACLLALRETMLHGSQAPAFCLFARTVATIWRKLALATCCCAEIVCLQYSICLQYMFASLLASLLASRFALQCLANSCMPRIPARLGCQLNYSTVITVHVLFLIPHYSTRMPCFASPFLAWLTSLQYSIVLCCNCRLNSLP